MPAGPTLAVLFDETPSIARLAHFHKLEAGDCR